MIQKLFNIDQIRIEKEQHSTQTSREWVSMKLGNQYNTFTLILTCSNIYKVVNTNFDEDTSVSLY
jgi:hypothetical protein